MATSFRFDNKIVKLAGIYSTIKSGIKNAPLALDYGKVMIIDTGTGSGWGFGSGINGTLKSGADAVYSGITDMGMMQSAMKGGLWWKLAELLFKPNGAQSTGASEIIFARAAETLPAEIQLTVTVDSSTAASMTIQCRDEGLVGNSSFSGGVLRTGYAAQFAYGNANPTKYVMKMIRGTFRGMDWWNAYTSWDDRAESTCKPEVVAISPEFSLPSELISWMQKDAVFNSLFKLSSSSITTDDFSLDAFASPVGATGGTESYSSTDLDKVLDIIKPLDYSLILVDNWSGDYDSIYNTKIHYHISEEARFTKIMIVGGGDDFGGSQTSKDAAQLFDADNAVVVHGGVYVASKYAPTGFKTFGSIYKAAAVTGRLAGLPPQVPITFKGLKYDGEVHALTKNEQEAMLDSGVLYTIWDGDLQKFTVAQGINTLQNNSYFINEDGTTYSIQIKRIAAQMNKEIMVNAKRQLFGNEAGVNRNTLSPKVVQDWLEGYLKSKLASPASDNLIIAFQDVTVERNQDAYFVSYKFQPNGEITKMFFTGFMID